MKKVSFTNAELKALITVADEGLAGLATDKPAARAYLGGQRGVNAARRALEKLHTTRKVRPAKQTDHDA